MKYSALMKSVATVTAVVILSIVSVQLWGSKSEEFELPEIQIESNSQKIAEIATMNEIPLIVVLKALETDSVSALRIK